MWNDFQLINNFLSCCVGDFCRLKSLRKSQKDGNSKRHQSHVKSLSTFDFILINVFENGDFLMCRKVLWNFTIKAYESGSMNDAGKFHVRHIDNILPILKTSTTCLLSSSLNVSQWEWKRFLISNDIGLFVEIPNQWDFKVLRFLIRGFPL